MPFPPDDDSRDYERPLALARRRAEDESVADIADSSPPNGVQPSRTRGSPTGRLNDRAVKRVDPSSPYGRIKLFLRE